MKKGLKNNLDRSWSKVSWLSNEWLELSLCSTQALDSIIVSDTAKTLKSDRTTTVVMAIIDKHSLIIKRYNDRSLWHIFKKALRQTRARRCWVMSEHFRQAGLNVAEPVAVLEKRYGPIRRQSYFVSEFLSGQVLLDSLLSLNQQQQEAVKQEMIRAFTVMQEQKISHGDLKASNLIWHQGKLYFIDLDAAKSHWSMWSWNRAHRKDRKRFMKNWRQQPELLCLFSDLN